MALRGLLVEECKVVPAFVPIDTNGVGQDGDWVSMKQYRHCTAIVLQGAWAGGTPACTLRQATDVSGTAAKTLAFATEWQGTALTADLLTKNTVTSNTFNLAATANQFHVIEIEASSLDSDGGFDCVQVRVATPGANADLIAAVYILSGTRFQDQAPPSAIID